MNARLVGTSGVLGTIGAVLLLGGCASLIAPQIIAPQPGGLQGAYEKSLRGQFVLANIAPYISARPRIAVGPPPATLAVEVIPPGNYSLRLGARQRPGCTTIYLTGPAENQLFASLDRECLAQHHLTVSELKVDPPSKPLVCTAPPPSSPTLQRYRASIVRLRSTEPPRGTVILLPGYGIGKLSMLPWALMLGEAGYQSILVDPRAQGQSSGQYVTYGALESEDVVQLVAALRKEGLIRGRLGLLGDSMGAATALLAAAHIEPLAAVVAISPYERATAAIPRYARLAHWYARFIPPMSWRAAEHQAGRMAGVSLAEADPIEAAPHIRAPVLYLQGDRDRVVSPAQARQLAERTPGARLEMFPGLGHLEMSENFAGLAQPVINWFNRYVAQDHAQAQPPRVGLPQGMHNVLEMSGCVEY